MESERAKSLAHAVRALSNLEEDFGLVKKDFNQRIETLNQTIHRLSNDILTGQAELPLEGEAEKAHEKAVAAGDHVLDSPTVPKPKRHRPAPPPSEAAPF